MAKTKDFRCNVCERGFDTEQFLINHFHVDHPEDGLTLWDSIGRTGYAFADIVVGNLRSNLHTTCELNDQLRNSEAKCRKLLDESHAELRGALLDLELVRRIVTK